MPGIGILRCLAFYVEANLSAIWQIRNLPVQVAEKRNVIVDVDNERRVRRTGFSKYERDTEPDALIGGWS